MLICLLDGKRIGLICVWNNKDDLRYHRLVIHVYILEYEKVEQLRKTSDLYRALVPHW